MDGGQEMTQAYHLDNLLSLRLFEPFIDNVLDTHNCAAANCNLAKYATVVATTAELFICLI